MNCLRYKNNRSNFLRKQKSDFKHFNLKCWKSTCRARLQKNKRIERFFCNCAKSQDRVIITSQLKIFVRTVALPASRSNFVGYTSNRQQMFYKIGALKNFAKYTCVGVSFAKEIPAKTFSCERRFLLLQICFHIARLDIYKSF